MADAGKGGVVRRFFGWLFSPSARWSVFALVVVGLVVGVVGVIGTQVAVAMTGTDEFCGNAAVELMFKVEVKGVSVLNTKGKTKKFGKTMGRRDNVRKAYVTLKPGQELNLSGEAA